jgi:hypothetical protein
LLLEALPKIQFLSSSLQGKVPMVAPWVETPLPDNRSGSFKAEEGLWTYGRYFQAIKEVIAGQSGLPLLEAAQKQLRADLSVSDLQDIRIYAEKHGNLYHPAKIEVDTRRGCARFVMNVALTERGRAAMFREVANLRTLTENYPYPWLPYVYFYTDSDGPSSAQGGQAGPESMFLANWFEGFYEFHQSIDPVDNSQKLILWDGSPRPNYLSHWQTRRLYAQISKILTLYYNPETYEQIFPWHHGAGDFVVKVADDGVDVRLVTVRQYGAMADPSEMDRDEALLFFFLNLSVRMRLDRLDGVGELIWAGDECLDMTWEGFKEALPVKEREGVLAPGFGKNFLETLSRISGEALFERFLALLESYNPQTPDLPVIKQGVATHLARVHDLMNGRK